MPARISEKEARALAASRSALGERSQPTKGSNKFGAKRTEVDGLKFDSAREARRYGELRTLSRAGKVNGLALQIAFPLIVNGVQVAKYVCDFLYFDERGVKVVEDVKSAHTRKLPVYRLKAKMFAAQYGFQIREV